MPNDQNPSRSSAATAAEIVEMAIRVQQEADRQFSPTYPNPVHRYRNDAQYHALVDMVRAFVHKAQFTPTEIREALILACIMEESYRTDLISEPSRG